MFRLEKKTTTLHVHHAFLYISLPSLHNYDVKLTGTQDNDFLFLFVNLGAVLYNSTPEENRKHLTIKKSCNNGDEVWSSATSPFGWRFRCRCRRLFLRSQLETFRLEDDIFFPYSHSQKIDTPDSFTDKTFKTQSTRTFSNFDFQWTKFLYQKNLKHIAFFPTFSKG